VGACLEKIKQISTQYRLLLRRAAPDPAGGSGHAGQQRHQPSLQKGGWKPASRLLTSARSVLKELRRWCGRVRGDLPEGITVLDDLLNEDVDVAQLLLSGGAGCDELYFNLFLARMSLCTTSIWL